MNIKSIVFSTLFLLPFFIISCSCGEEINEKYETGGDQVYDINSIKDADTEETNVSDTEELGVYDVVDIKDIQAKDVEGDVFPDIIEDILDVGLDVGDISDCEISDPKHLWSKRFGGSDYDKGYSVSVDSSGNVYITGSFESSTIDFGGGALTNATAGFYADIFLAKFDSNGNHLWSKRFGGNNNDRAYSVSVDKSDNLYIAG
jgi:hypothetical protein